MGRIPDQDIDKVREATDVVELVRDTVNLRQKGRVFWGLCPFHNEKTPSFKVDPTTGLWHCFGCGAGGDAFGFLMRQENLEFPDSVRLLADRANIEIHEEGGGLEPGERERLIEACEAAADFYHEQLTKSRDAGAQKARNYLKSRGFGSDVAKRFRLGYAPYGRDTLVRALERRGVTRDVLLKSNLALADEGGRLKDRFFDRVMFPIADLTGRTVAFGGRVIDKGAPKYLNSQETPVFHKASMLYALDRAKNEVVRSGAVVVEGYTDVIALHEAGVGNAVATLGTALTARHVRTLSRFGERVVYLFDGDEAGMRAATRAAEFLEWQATPESRSGRVDLRVAIIPDGMDPADFVEAHGSDAVAELVDGADPLVQFVLDQRLAEHDLSGPEGRSAALTSAVRVLAGLKGSILAQDYANYLADRLQTDYETVRLAMADARPEFAAPEREDASAEAGRDEPETDPAMRAERELARLAVLEPDLREGARELLDGGLVTSSRYRSLAERAVAAGGAAESELWGALGELGERDVRLVSGWLVDAPADEDRVAAFRELSLRLKEFDLKRQITGLRSSMEELDPAADKHEYDEMFRRVVALQHELTAVRDAARDGGDTEG
jgi:DNA primase